MRGLGLEGGMFVPAPSWEIFTMPKQGDSAAAAGWAARDQAATVGGTPKSASWSDLAFFFTDSEANKAEVKTKPAATMEGKTKAAALTSFFIEPAARVEGEIKAASVTSFFIEPAARVEGKIKAALGARFQPAASVEGKPKQAVASGIESAARLEDKPKREPLVVEVKIERVGEDYIQYLRKNPMRRPPSHSGSFFEQSTRLRESCRVTDASINKIVDLKEHILEQYDTKGYAMVRVEYLDNGRKRLFRLPEEDTV
ncbi:unnamed protein product [Urochloa humidicola]